MRRASRPRPMRARVVLGRIQLERYRRHQPPQICPARSPRSRRRCPPARSARADRARDRSRRSALPRGSIWRRGGAVRVRPRRFAMRLARPAHERVLDWWATASTARRSSGRCTNVPTSTARIATRMAARDFEGCRDRRAAGYWLAAAARGAGDPERALNEATAAWVRASLARDGGIALRADLDRLVVQGILPDRAARLTVRDHDPGARRDGWRMGSVQVKLVAVSVSHASSVSSSPLSSSLRSPRRR